MPIVTGDQYVQMLKHAMNTGTLDSKMDDFLGKADDNGSMFDQLKNNLPDTLSKFNAVLAKHKKADFAEADLNDDKQFKENLTIAIYNLFPGNEDKLKLLKEQAPQLFGSFEIKEGFLENQISDFAAHLKQNRELIPQLNQALEQYLSPKLTEEDFGNPESLKSGLAQCLKSAYSEKPDKLKLFLDEVKAEINEPDHFIKQYNAPTEQAYSLAAINVGNVETIQAAIQGAVKAGSPLILQVSQGAMDYMGGNADIKSSNPKFEDDPEAYAANFDKMMAQRIRGAILISDIARTYAESIGATVPIALHTDHAIVEPLLKPVEFHVARFFDHVNNLDDAKRKATEIVINQVLPDSNLDYEKLANQDEAAVKEFLDQVKAKFTKDGKAPAKSKLLSTFVDALQKAGAATEYNDHKKDFYILDQDGPEVVKAADELLQTDKVKLRQYNGKVLDEASVLLDALIKESANRKDTKGLLYNSHMLDAAKLPLMQNLGMSKGFLSKMAPIGQVLELETGDVGGVEDGREGHVKYTKPEEAHILKKELGDIGFYLHADTLGNSHGRTGSGEENSNIKPWIQDELAEIMKGVRSFCGFVCHGGSGIKKEKIALMNESRTTKINYDTDNQIALTQGVVGFFKNYVMGIFKNRDKLKDNDHHIDHEPGKGMFGLVKDLMGIGDKDDAEKVTGIEKFIEGIFDKVFNNSVNKELLCDWRKWMKAGKDNMANTIADEKIQLVGSADKVGALFHMFQNAPAEKLANENSLQPKGRDVAIAA